MEQFIGLSKGVPFGNHQKHFQSTPVAKIGVHLGNRENTLGRTNSIMQSETECPAGGGGSEPHLNSC